MPAFQKMDDEWNAKRRDIDIAMETLPADMQTQAQLRLKALTPTPPPMGTTAASIPPELQTENFILTLDPASGAIVKLKNRKTARDWASAQHPLASFRYDFTSADFARFNAEYNTAKFAANDFGKPGLEKFRSKAARGKPV